MSKLSVIILSLLLLFAAAPAHADEMVDINTASAAELARVLEGVGRARAEAIVEHRDRFGPFTSIDELRYVNGVGAATVERNRARMTVGDVERTAAVDER